MPTWNETEVLREEREKTSAALLLADVEIASSFFDLAKVADKVEVKEQRLAEALRAVESVVNRLHLTRLTQRQRNLLVDRLRLLRLKIADTAFSPLAAA
jgi:hypothetical protein